MLSGAQYELALKSAGFQSFMGIWDISKAYALRDFGFDTPLAE